VSTKKSPILKHWLTASSVAFGVSCGFTLPFTQNLAQSALIGLATVPGSAATMTVRFRKRKQRVNRQLEQEKRQLYHLQQQGAMLDRQLQIKGKERQDAEARVAQLHSLAVNLTDRVATDRQQYQQLEQKLTSLTYYCQERQALVTKLDRNIQEKQAQLLSVDTDLHGHKLQISQLQAAETRLNEAIETAKAKLKDIRAEIHVCLTTKQELEHQIQQLQHQITCEAERVVDEEQENFEESIEQKHALIHKLDTAISDRVKNQQELVIEIDRLEQIRSQLQPEITDREQQIVNMRLQLSETALELTAKQGQLKDLSAQMLKKRSEIEGCDRSLKMASLELSSKQAELDNLELQVDAKTQSLEPDPWLAKDMQNIEPKPPIISRNIELIEVDGAWYDRFIDNPHLAVLQHIEKHGTITEAEASSKLGNPRSVRQFANKLEEYTQKLPFAIRVESSPAGNRYIKENHN
jgi:chromosome segregation ATPase